MSYRLCRFGPDRSECRTGLWQPALVLIGSCIACSAPVEAPRVDVPVSAGSNWQMPQKNDLGYDVELSEVHLVVQDFVFAGAGEAHAGTLWQGLRELLIPSAYAHPGHHETGEVTGQMQGRYVLDWPTRGTSEIGIATLFVGSYASANFTFGRAQEHDAADEDALLGHTARLVGVARKDDLEVPFTVTLTAPTEHEVLGVPCAVRIDESPTQRLVFQLELLDKTQGETVFDQVDFSALVREEDASLDLYEGSDDEAIRAALNQIQTRLQRHDHFGFELTGDD